MNVWQTLHQVNLTTCVSCTIKSACKKHTWAARFQEQTVSGLTVKEWCSQNNLSIHTYNYWKHALKKECVVPLLPDIVPISLPPGLRHPLSFVRPNRTIRTNNHFLSVSPLVISASKSVLLQQMR